MSSCAMEYALDIYLSENETNEYWIKFNVENIITGKITEFELLFYAKSYDEIDNNYIECEIKNELSEREFEDTDFDNYIWSRI